MKFLKCLGISPGMATGPVFIYDSDKRFIEKGYCIDPVLEISKLDKAISLANTQIQDLRKKALINTSNDLAEIFEAHLMILEDPELADSVNNLVNIKKFTAEYAWYSAIDKYEKMISSLQDEILAERSTDIHDVGQRVLRNLLGINPPIQPDRPSIIVTDELSPSDIVSFDNRMTLAFCTAHGGPTSHTAILCRAMGIPAISAIEPWLSDFHNGLDALVDGTNGVVILNPDENTRKSFSNRSSEFAKNFEIALAKARYPANSTDDHLFEVEANIGSPNEAIEALHSGADGVGLLRTEFCFLGRDTPPTEDEQYLIYSKILKQFGEKPVVVRTLDFGGDKRVPYLNIPRENNPFLGLRGIRLLLKRQELFQSQLKALLRAGIGHNLKIMFPMISSINDLQSAKEQITWCISLLDRMGIEYNPKFEIGLMVEIPSAAIMADVLCQEADFFSIGTNDLTQYTLAADRTNSQVAEFADALDPAVLRLIELVTKAAHKSGKWVGICGELASDPAAVPVLMGLHIDEFSMSARSIPIIKEEIRKFSFTQAEKIASQVLTLPSADKVRGFLSNRGKQ